MADRIPWLVSPRFDVGWFLAPGLLAVALGLAIGVGSTAQPVTATGSLGFWIASVLLVDVAHVYSTLYRTYLDSGARAIHRRRLVFAPLACLWFGTLAHLESPRLFWGALAYLAVFHFIKQHVGFALLYARAGHESARDRTLARLTVWAGTALPVVHWHANLPTNFAWFTENDFIPGLPAVVGDFAIWIQLPVLLAFVGRRLQLGAAGVRNPMLVALTLGPALTWNMGIVWFDDDRIFTLTNVVFHGVPYIALVWVAGGRDRVRSALGRGGRRIVVPLVAVVFYGAIAVLAFVEEAAWDRLVWHDRPELFGATDVALAPLPLAFVVALLTVPQATHYLLDRWIWRPGPQNPELADQLGLRGG